MKYPKQLRNYKIFIPVIVVFAVFGAGAAWMVHAYAASASTDAIAGKIVAACANSGPDHSACYEAEIPNLYPKLSVPQIFDVVREVLKLDPSYQFCHTLGHKIGIRVVSEDPTNWLDYIPLNPSDGLCSNGFIHGVFEARFGADVLTDAEIKQFMPQFREACQPHDGWNPSELDQAICYHGMGHLADYITNANLTKALNFCSDVAPSQYQRVCYEGVFMEIFQQLEPDDVALFDQMPVKPTKPTIRQFCARFSTDPEWEGSCLEESWPMFEPVIVNGTGVQTFCSGQPDATETKQCYVSMASIIGRMHLADPQAAVSACKNFPVQWQETCFYFTAQANLEENLSNGQQAVHMCEEASPSVAQQCLTDLANTANFTFGDKSERSAFCALLPSDLQTVCENSPQQTSDIQYSDVTSSSQ